MAKWRKTEALLGLWARNWRPAFLFSEAGRMDVTIFFKKPFDTLLGFAYLAATGRRVAALETAGAAVFSGFRGERSDRLFLDKGRQGLGRLFAGFSL